MDIRKNLELKRKLFHLFFGLLIILAYYLDVIDVRDMLFILIISIIFFFFYKTHKVRFLDFFVHHFERPSTKHIGIGIINFILGVYLVMLLFEKNIAIAAIAVLAIGDSISPLVGLHFGRFRIKVLSEEKMIEGVIAGILLSSIVGAFFVPFAHIILAATVAMVFEMVELKHKIDDNILIPLIAGIILFLLSLL